MSQIPNITVVIPTMGSSTFLLETIRSISSQTVPVAQILLVEDGIKEKDIEGTREIVSQFPTVEVHRLDTRQGVSAARNVGLENATGDYLVFLDDDDLLHPKMLEHALAIFNRHRAIDAVVCLYQVIFTPAGAGDYPELFPFNPNLMNKHPLNAVDMTNFAPKKELEVAPVSAFLRYLIPINSCVVKRSAIGDTRFPEDLTQGEDTYFWLTLAHKGSKFHLSQKPYAYVRRHGQNTTRAKSVYIGEIPKCYFKIQSSGLLSRRQDVFLVKLKLFYFTWKKNRLASLGLFFGLLQYPIQLVQETTRFFRVTVRDRRRLMKYYFLD